MEIMEDGSLVDRVRILLQRDMQYYQEMQTVLKEALCVRVSGGKLDFPRHASFAAIKIVMWWEAEFLITFKRSSGLSTVKCKNSTELEANDGVVKNVQPSEFILMVVDTADQLLEHLHTLIQECLDHADLTVLTATLGAAALIRNCLWCYNQYVKNVVSAGSSEKINNCYKSYHEMAEAVAERLLDLHCRLISLYILNEADSLGWNSNKSFFERERCSFVIQMWWLYMQGTKADLWETVPPQMAQRVFTGMVNESLSIIVTRFIYGRPTLARSEQFWTDAFNVLCCTGYLSLAACTESEEMIGARSNKLPTIIRDIHAKCNELFVCLLFRGTPLEDLYQVWNQSRPPWLNALLVPLKTMMSAIVDTLLDAVKTGASMYQAMSLALACFTELHVTTPIAILRTALALNNNVPARCHPLGNSVLLQIFSAALYSTFLEIAANNPTDVQSSTISIDVNLESGSFNPHDKIAASNALAEAICSIDEDNKHTAQIDYFSQTIEDSVKAVDQNPRCDKLKNMTRIIETYTDELLLTKTGRQSLKITHEYLLCASDWVLNRLRNGGSYAQPDLIDFSEIPLKAKPLTHIMFHIEDTDFDQFLTNYESTNWKKVLTMPLSVSLERARSQILARPEFKNIGELSQEEREVVNSIKRICSSVRSARFK
ncbi:uncharacterized protein LOC122522360 isoform X4 [Polistes fuscatus]|uniref:uncharacterized protein LOC122522360 isoform X4 n=1 Tax=Polistes fuscatus TaxID=30207 RepID=UPI001CA97F2D|nr:uncharacterized protein LOC122522360 isoform X4 [Polistes fuscatus]